MIFEKSVCNMQIMKVFICVRTLFYKKKVEDYYTIRLMIPNMAINNSKQQNKMIPLNISSEGENDDPQL